MKQHKYTILYIFFIFGVSLFAFTGFLFLQGQSHDTASSERIEQEVSIKKTVELSIDHGVEHTTISIISDTTILDILTMLDSEDETLDLTLTEYDGLGTLVESMYGYTNGTDDKYWQYTVNGVMPQIGASELVPNDGDVIVWSFTSFDINN